MPGHVIRLLPALFVSLALQATAQVTWRTDSLMMTWAVQEKLRAVGNTLNRGVVRAVSTSNLYEDLKREAPGIPVFADSNVVMYTDLYGESLREQFRVLLGVSAAYFPMIEKELALQGLPNELKYLPMALSGLNTLAGSTQGGGGLWMLTYPVALRYGLVVTDAVDERHDDVKSTMAAGRYLSDLYARYQDWGLTIMAFACGPANVTRAQQRTGGATDYRSLYPHFTDGVQEVLPLMMAFIHLTSNAGELGIEPIGVLPWEAADTVTAGRQTDLRAVAQVMQLPYARLRSLNPTFCGGKVPVGRPFQLPRSTSECYRSLNDSLVRVEAALAQATAAAPQVEAEKLVSVVVQKSIRYKVRSGDSLGKIAAKHHVTIRQLKSWNNLRSDRINAGRTLVIHVKRHELVKPAEPEPQLPEDEGPVNSTPTVAPDVRVEQASVQRPNWSSYTVQRGDTLYRIAKRFPGLTAQHLMDVNGISTTIKPGQKLKIPRP